MKTKTILFLFLLISGMMFAQEVKRVAILETVDKENKVSYANKLILRANLSKAITNTAGYEAYDRTDIDAIMGEQNFQRTGLVSNDQIKRLGEMTGANYILVAEAVVVDARNMFITAKLLDVETARTIMTDNVMMGTSADAIQEGCMVLAKKLFHEEVKKEVILVTDNDEAKVETLSFEDKLVRYSLHEQKWMGVKKYSYGNTQMDEEAFRKFLMNNDREAFLKYMKSQQMIPTGWVLLSIGGGLMLGGLIDYAIEGDTSFAKWIAPPIASAFFAAGIPLLCIGYKNRDKSIELINSTVHEDSSLSLNLQASQNGIGLALNF